MLHYKLQKYLPQHLLSTLVGMLANSEISFIKNTLIKYFMKFYPVNMQEAVLEEPYSYKTFNHFFTRSIKPNLRPISADTNSIVSPADGTIYQISKINGYKLLQAKGQTFTISDLFGPKINHGLFKNGGYINIYLSPSDYHRVHMPLTGTLMQMNYIPGKLFSVNNTTVNYIPNLFAKNERVVTIFQTDAGLMAVILIGAMIVGNIETSWASTINPIHAKQPLSIKYESTSENSVHLDKGSEVGLFKMGSTVIVLLANDRIEWSKNLVSNSNVKMGQQIGMFS